jgi:iron complex transport system substrate-binding protein
MKRLWIISAVTLICVAVLLIAFYRNHNHEKTLPIPPAKPGRIVSLAPNLTEILFALGLGDKIVAASSDSDYPAQAALKEKVGTFWQPNIEAIIAARPDLVLTLAFEQQKTVAETLKRLRINVLTLKIEKIDELLAAIKQIGTTTGKSGPADKLVTDITERMNNLKLKLAQAQKPKVLWVIQTEPLRVAGRNTFVNELIQLAGGENTVGPTIQQYPSLGSEELLASTPQVIIQSAMGQENLSRQQLSAEAFWAKWPTLPAVKNKKIYVINPDTVLRLGPRFADGIEFIAQHLHPDIFAESLDIGSQLER